MRLQKNQEQGHLEFWTTPGATPTTVFGGPCGQFSGNHVVLGIEVRLSTCKASASTSVLSLQPKITKFS